MTETDPIGRPIDWRKRYIEADRAEIASLRAAVLALREALEQIRKLDTRRTPTGALDVGLNAEIAERALAATAEAGAAIEARIRAEERELFYALKEAASNAAAWFLLPENMDLTGSDRVYLMLEDALAAAPPSPP